MVTFETELCVFWCVTLLSGGLRTFFILAGYDMETKKKACCFLGHRKIAEKEKVREKLTEIIENLITEENVDVFHFGSRSEFDDLCRDVLADKKEKYPNIRRIYIRAEYQYIDKDYENYLLESCEETYFSRNAENAGAVSYIKRNFEMIDKSDVCIVYYKKDYLPQTRKKGMGFVSAYQPKSGTAIAYEYAKRKKKIIINIAEEL